VKKSSRSGNESWKEGRIRVERGSDLLHAPSPFPPSYLPLSPFLPPSSLTNPLLLPSLQCQKQPSQVFPAEARGLRLRQLDKGKLLRTQLLVAEKKERLAKCHEKQVRKCNAAKQPWETKHVWSNIFRHRAAAS
jgi:hypothetical protein